MPGKDLDLIIIDAVYCASRLQEIKAHQQEDEVCKQLMSFVINGWLHKSQLKGPVKKYYSVSSELSVIDGLLLRGNRIVVPSALQSFMKDTKTS